MELEPRSPDPAPDLPVGLRKILRPPALAHLHDGNVIALLGKTVSGDTAPKARADHDEVVVQPGIGHRCLLRYPRPLYPENSPWGSAYTILHDPETRYLRRRACMRAGSPRGRQARAHDSQHHRRVPQRRRTRDRSARGSDAGECDEL